MSKKLTKKQYDESKNGHFLRKFTGYSLFLFCLLLNSFLTAQEKELPAIQLPSSTENAQTTQVAQTESSTENTLPPYYEVPIETAAFNGIVPGHTQVAQLHKEFGSPANTQKDGAGKGIDIEEYRIEGFKAVAFHIMNQTVMAVIAELEESMNARELASSLGMEHIQSVFITDEKGVIKGEIYPEIGVAFAYDPNKPLGNVADMAKNPTGIPMNALQILFQPVGPDPFLLRAETWVDIEPKRAYRDILQALKMDPKNQKALAYQKIITDAVPELKEMTLETLTSQMPEAEEKATQTAETQIAETKIAETKTEETKTEETKTEEIPSEKTPEVASASELPETPELPEAPELPTSPKENVAVTLPEATELPQIPGEIHEEKTQEKTEVTNNAELTELTPPNLDTLTDSAENDTENKSAPSETVAQSPELAPELPTSPDSLPEIPGGIRVPTDEEVLGDESTDQSASHTSKNGSLRILPKNETEKTPLELPSELEQELDTLEEPSETEKNQEFAELELSFENELFENVEYLARSQRIPQALELLDEIRKKFLDNPFVSFRVNIVEGDILMILPTPDVQQAFRCHRRAAEQGEKLLAGGKVIRGRRYPLTKSEKMAIQELLLDAWLGVASDLATGDWDQKVSNCQKWLLKVQQQIDLLVPPSQKEPTPEMVALRYKTTYRMLSIAILLGESIDITEYASRLISAGQEQLRVAESPQHYYEVCTETALLLDDAGSICILRSEDVAAQRYLTRAIALMERVKESKEKKNEDLSMNEAFLLSQLYYHTGQIFAWRANRLMAGRPENIEVINQKRLNLHEQAIEWYEKSIPLLMSVIRTKEWHDLLQLSRIVNGMSVSYMETSDTKRALVLLKTGIFCLEQHVATHPEDKFQLAIPYRNIIRVLTYQGNREEREKYEQKLNALGI